LPERYQTAVWQVSSTVRVAPSYHDTATTVSIFANFDHLNREMFTVFDRDFHGH